MKVPTALKLFGVISVQVFLLWGLAGMVACKLCQRFRKFRSVGIQMERSVSVSSDRNIRDHLWRWSTYFGRNIRPKFTVPFLKNGFFALIREFGKTIQNDKSLSLGWPGLIGKCHSIFLRYSH